MVGHKCTYEGSMPEDKIARVVLEWPACKDKTEVRAFLGTAGQLRTFIWNYAKKAMPLTRLTGNVPFEWTPGCDTAMGELKDGIKNCPALRPINHDWDVRLGVDTSYKAVGWYIYQRDPNNPKTKYYCYFGCLGRLFSNLSTN